MVSKRLIVIIFCVLAGYSTFSQGKPSVKIGSGLVHIGSRYGLGSNSDLIFPLRKNFSYGLNIGYAMASDKNIITNKAGAFSQSSIFAGNFELYYHPEVVDKVELLMFGGGGVRHFNSTQILVNSNLELSPFNDYSTGLGFNAGLGADYNISTRYALGIRYLHDFYKEGFDYFGISFGILIE